MASRYPIQIDSLPIVVDNFTPVKAAVVNNIRDAVMAVEAELGIKPSGIYGTVRARLDALETGLNSIVTTAVSFGGDLQNINPTSQKVIGLQSIPINATIPADGYVLTYSLADGYWHPAAAGSSTLPVATVANSVLQRSYPPGTDPSFFAPLTLDQILAAYSCSLFYAGATIVETSATVATPAFTASYLRTAAAAVLTDTIPTTPQDVIGTPTTFSLDANALSVDKSL